VSSVTPTDPGRRQQAALVIAAVASKGSPMLMAIAMAVYIGRAGGSPLSVGLVVTAFFFGWTVCSPVWGAIADVTGRRRAVLLVASGLATLATLPLLVVRGVVGPLAIRTVYALFAAAYLPILLTIVNTLGGDDQRGRSVGLFSSAQGAGSTIGQLSAGFLLGLLAPWSLYLVVTLVTAAVFLAVLVVDDPTPGPARSLSVGEVGREVRRRLFPSRESRAHFRTNGLRWLYLAVLFRNVTVLGVGSLLPVYLVETLGLTEATMGALLAINPAGQIVFMYLSGGLADRLGRKPLISVGMAGSGGSAALLALASSVGARTGQIVVAAVGMFVLAVAFSLLRVGAVSFIGDVAPVDRESELIGFRSTARGLGGIVGPVAVGGLASVVGYGTAFLVASSLAFAAAVLVALTLTESLPEPTATPTA
jgi:MFS family permease